jgi:hypothetical protein
MHHTRIFSTRFNLILRVILDRQLELKLWQTLIFLKLCMGVSAQTLFG